MKPKIVILNIYQLGYHTDTYNYCRYLKSDFDIAYVSFNQGFEDIVMEGIKAITIPQPRGFWNLINGYINLAHLIKNEKPDLVFIVYVRFISIVRFFIPNTKFIFDIRTGSLFKNASKRYLWNSLLRLESVLFRRITIISEGLRKGLHITARKCTWLPLGGNIIFSKKDFSSLQLLYIGTLDQRNIHTTIEGFARFKNEFPSITVSYDIAGYGKEETEELIRSTIAENCMEEFVRFHGRVPYYKVEDFLKRANIGIVYLPITPYYDHQPTTKLFEFLLSGIPVIATNTSENRSIVNDSNGILISDNVEDFYNGLKQMKDKHNQYNEESIRNSVNSFTWESIVKQNLKPVLLNAIND
jgi:glycosyltransferase involved in cell wall biosynthesis